MRLPIFGLVLAAVPLLIGCGLSRAANQDSAPTPGLSPETVDSLVGEAVVLRRTYSDGGSAGLAVLKQHEAELEDLKAQLCSAVIHC